MVTGVLKSRKGAEERRDGGVGSGIQTVETGEGLLSLMMEEAGLEPGNGAASRTRRPPSTVSHHGHGPHLHDLNAGPSSQSLSSEHSPAGTPISSYATPGRALPREAWGQNGLLLQAAKLVRT